MKTEVQEQSEKGKKQRTKGNETANTKQKSSRQKTLAYRFTRRLFGGQAGRDIPLYGFRSEVPSLQKRDSGRRNTKRGSRWLKGDCAELRDLLQQGNYPQAEELAPR